MESKLLTAWAFGVSLGTFGESKSSLLKHAMKCTVRFAALLQLIPNSLMHSENDPAYMLNFLKKLLHFTPWDRANSQGPLLVGIMVELCRNLVQLVLTPYTESYQRCNCEISSYNLSTALQIIQMFSQSLDQTFSLQQRSIWSSDGKESSQPLELWPSDLHSVPVLQTETREETDLLHRPLPGLVMPSRRLRSIWTWIYTITQKYMEELEHFKGGDNWEMEKQQLVVIMCKIQTVLQTSGKQLEESNRLLKYTGEHLFLSGYYTESSEVWFSQLLKTSKKSGKSTVFQEKRLCLALLYSLLSQYHLKQAQELGDHMACLILQTNKHQEDGSRDGITTKKESFQCLWLSKDLSTDAAYAVVQTLGRFMASYFSNKTLYILPPHNVDVLPPIHMPHASCIGRLVPLCHEEVAKAVRQQQLSEIWTVEYAQDLLLLGGLLPESVWLAYHLGDWKAAVSLSQAYSCYCKQHFDFTGFNRRELCLPKDLEPANILQAELDCLLGGNGNSKEQRETDANQTFSDPVDEEDWSLLQVSIKDILKASTIAGVDAVSSPLSSLLNKAKDLCSCLTAMVPTALYLPSPPLYCPQPSLNTQDLVGIMGCQTEVASRHRISKVVQKLLLLLRSANCCYPAAQWYLNQLRRARHVLYKMRKKYSYPSAIQEEKSFPDGLLKFINRSGYFRWGPKKNIDPGTIQTIICFRELCGLCWMLHIRDKLSLSCRKYQADRQQARDDQTQEDSEMRSPCVDALQWAQRFLPFSRFLNCEEIVQDIILSLLSELPPVLLVADTLVLSFPEEEESIRVPLREKYNTIMQTLRQCNVIGTGKETGEIMMVLIQDKLRLRKKHFGRLRRHLAPLELHLWEKEIEEEEGRSKHGMARLKQLSLGTSLSTSTLTDCGLLPLQSDVDTVENMSETPVSPNPHTTKTKFRTKKSKIRDRRDKTSKKVKNVITEEGPSGEAKDEQHSSINQPSLPLVGSWEFELEDAEYLNFLELFLSYLLEKDTADTSNELPLLKDFSHKLREKELHSLAFDVLTTMHRRQRDAKNNQGTHIFRAGSCFRPMTQDTAATTSAVSSESSLSPKHASSTGFLQHTTGLHKGLLSHQNQLHDCSQGSIKTSPVRGFFQTQASENLRFCSVAPAVEVMQSLNAEFEAQFPELGRLLVWMMRWADSRLLLGQHGKKRKKGGEGGETADEGVVIRIKASAPAVLTSLCLMQHRYTAVLGMDFYRTHMQIPNTQWIVAPVLELPTDRKVEKERRVDTSLSLSTNMPTTVLDSNIKASSIGSCGCEDQLHPSTLISSSSSHSPEGANVALQEEDRDTHYNDWKHSSISSEICTPGTSLKLADLENPQPLSHSVTLEPVSSPHTNLQICSTDKEESVVQDGGSKVQSSSQGPDPRTQPSSAVPPLVSCVPDLATETSEMRQRLGEDLYKLVQNINYMSLMEVLGASFSNLQLAQQNASLVQSDLNLNVNVPLLNVHNAMPPPSAPPPTETHSQPSPSPEQFTQVPVYMDIQPVSTGVNMNLQTAPSSAFSHRPVLSGGKDMTPLSVQAGSPVRNSRNNLIPCSEGLLTTAEIKQTVPKTPVLPPSSCSLQSDPAPLLLGLKLLQLRPPKLPAHVSQQGPQSLRNYPHNECSSSVFKYNDLTTMQKCKYAKNIHFTVEAQHQHVPVNSNSNQTRPKGQEVPPIPQDLPVCSASTPQGLRLLRVQPVSSSNITFPKLPTNTFSGLHTAHAIPIGETPRIKLLQTEPQPKMMLPLQTSSSQLARLIPDKHRSALGKQQNDNAQVHLLRAMKPTNDPNKSTIFHNSNKRQKRREKLEQAAREITFHPKDSIIPQETTYDFPTENHASEEAISEPGCAMPSGPLLRGEGLLEKAFATAAELHAFASTCKRPPECHDASTNTDPAPVFREDQTHNKCTFQDHLQLTEERHLTQDSHQFVSVVDLEDKSLHQDLPLCHNNHFSACAEATTAGLHVMATRVLRNDTKPQSSHEAIYETFQGQTSVPVDNKESVLHSPFVLEVDQEDFAVESCESKAKIIRAIKTQPLMAQKPTVWFSSKMSHLDSQLTALQRIADSLETDFSKSRMLENTIEKLSPVPSSEKKASIGVKKTVRLYSPLEMRTPQHATSAELSDSFQPQIAGSTNIHTPPGRKYDLAELSEISNISLTDETLEETGLSDTAEILDQLVREGFLSPTDLDTSSTKYKRLDLEQKGIMSKKGLMPQDEKRELRIWMRKKQRERLVVYQKHRQNLREMEHRPFSSPTKVKCVTKTANMKSKWEPIRVLDHFNQRTLEACNLANDLSASPPRIHFFSDTAGAFRQRAAGSPSFALPFGNTYRVYNASVRNKCPSENTHSRSTGIKDILSDEYHKRLGLDRPVTSLPRDRLSQVTRRGMLTHPRSSKLNAGNDKIKSRSPSRSTAFKRDHPNETENPHGTFKIYTERDASHLNVPGLEYRQEEQDNSIGGDTQWDWLDNLSETGSSNVSKIDWAAIERMVAEET